MLAALESRLPRREALAALLERYILNADSGIPVHRWPTATDRPAVEATGSATPEPQRQKVCPKSR